MPVCAVGEERTTTILDTTAQRARHPGLSGVGRERDMADGERNRAPTKSPTDHEAEFIKLFDKVSRGQNRYEMWDAFVSSFAALIATASRNDCEWLRQRAESALSSTIATTEQIAELWMVATDALEDNPKQDLFGSLYMKLGLGSKENGQFFTPYNISGLMANLSFPSMDEVSKIIDDRGYASVTDPAAGGGANLIAFANTCRDAGINYQQHVLFVAQELSELTAITCYVQLSLLGCPGIVYIGDTLRMDFRFKLLTPTLALDDIWLLRMAGRVVFQ